MQNEDQKAMSHVEGRDAFISAVRRAQPSVIRERIRGIMEQNKTVWEIHDGKEVPSA